MKERAIVPDGKVLGSAVAASGVCDSLYAEVEVASSN
jgi:hypothetical protein